MDRNEKIVVISTAVITAGSATVFAIKKIKRNRSEKIANAQIAAYSTSTTSTN